MNNKEVTKFLTMNKRSSLYTERDLKDAIELGKQLALEEVKLAMKGMVVNGICQSVLTEDKLQEILKWKDL